MSAARHEARLLKLDQARDLFKAKNLTTKQLSEAIDVSWESARSYINALLKTGEIKALVSKNPYNSMIAGVYGWAGSDGEPTAKAKDERPHRFNPAQWCVREPSGGAP